MLFRCIVIITITVMLSAPLALAHHVMDGALPSTFSQGLLSGFGHPIIGIDHLAFIVAVGLISLRFQKRFLLPLAFVAATLAGTGVHLLALNLPLVEIAIALSVLLLGALLLLQAPAFLPAILGVFAVAGLFHGYAYGESIIGAEQSVLLAYLLGFALIQYAIAVVAMQLARRFTDQGRASAPLRIGGGVIAAVGMAFLLQNLG